MLALTYPEEDMLLEVRLVESTLVDLKLLALTYPLALMLPPTITLFVLTTTMFDLEPTSVPFPMMKRSFVFELVVLYFPETCW